MVKPEILAPAGNLENLKVAVENGADAVYFGIDEFNARGNIENFTLENLGEVVSYCHLFGVKTYLTLNILLKDDEFKRADEIIEGALTSGIDAFIIQDIGLYYYIKTTYPNAEIHSSTQMGVQNLDGAKFMQDLGFKRVVLARETSLEDIDKIHKNLDIEIEYFIQGALCVSFSGNCYLCSLLAGSSGNRGKCKQFCRLPYTLEKGNTFREGYLLSTKDFCMAPMLKQLSDKGVVSFKIEGRARRAAYVGQAVKTYRKIVDNNFIYSDNEITDLKKVFNRGDYISGYFKNEKIIYSKAQNHIGIKIAKVESVNNGKRFNEVKVSSSHILKKGDVIKFFIDEKEVGIISVNDVKNLGGNFYKLTTTNVIPNKAEVRLIVDSEMEKEILQAKRTIQVKAYFNAEIGRQAKLVLEYNDVKTQALSDEPVQEAKTSPLSYDDIYSNLSKMGDEFKLEELEAEIGNVFMAKSQLNLLRRNALKALKSAILEKYKTEHNLIKKAKKTQKNIEIFEKTGKKSKIIAFPDFEKLNKNDFENDILIFKANNFSFAHISSLYEKYKNYNVYLSLPIIATGQEVENLKKVVEKCSNWGIVANNYYALNLVSKAKTIIGEGLNVFNSYAVKFYKALGFDKIILSSEVDEERILNSGTNLFYYQSFYPEYMTFKHCPIKENVGGGCDACKFKEGYTYKLNNKKFVLVRRKILNCQFVLKGLEKVERHIDKASAIVEV